MQGVESYQNWLPHVNISYFLREKTSEAGFTIGHSEIKKIAHAHKANGVLARNPLWDLISTPAIFRMSWLYPSRTQKSAQQRNKRIMSAHYIPSTENWIELAQPRKWRRVMHRTPPFLIFNDSPLRFYRVVHSAPETRELALTGFCFFCRLRCCKKVLIITTTGNSPHSKKKNVMKWYVEVIKRENNLKLK